MKKILVIDDDKELLDSLDKILSLRSEFNLTLISDCEKALQQIDSDNFDLVLTDLHLGKFTGMDILQAALKKNPHTIVILISGYGTIEAGIQAVNAGAYDFIEKPFTAKKLFSTIDKAFDKFYTIYNDKKSEEKEPEELKKFIYKNSKMIELLEIVKRISFGEMNVLISGESGTGKELIARLVHHLSTRKNQAFIPVNCGAFPEHLFESELFGHEQGAFTGAIKTKPGLLEFANGGTFFFDEIGEMSLTLQVKLLRMLEEKTIRRVGGQKQINIDIRIIAATNKNLKQMVEEKKFREDLYYRLNSITLEIPPLRDRKEEILPLANYFLKELCHQNNKHTVKFSADTEEILQSHLWPGNVRELQNVIGRAFYLCSNNIIFPNDLPIELKSGKTHFDNKTIELPYKDAKNQILEKFEIEYISYHLRKNNGNISKTAELCGIDRRTIHRLINELDIIYKE